ncbi:MAG: peptidylprolyl isomerase [Phycisphaerales bacterium]|nr:MAG: peptidylprolyl isomerase [Phycisphaerales bacterium]
MEADDLPRVELVTDRGRIVLELFENEAPNTVANFISLVEKGFYDETRFHRVIANFMAQGGDPNTRPDGTGEPGAGGPGYCIPDELNPETARKHFTGSLSMANRGPGTGGSQFFITVEPTAHLNGKHTVFGRVIEGLEVARRIKKDDVLQKATVLRKRDHAYAPSTLPDPGSPVLIPPRTDESPPPENVREGQ